MNIYEQKKQVNSPIKESFETKRFAGNSAEEHSAILRFTSIRFLFKAIKWNKNWMKTKDNPGLCLLVTEKWDTTQFEFLIMGS